MVEEYEGARTPCWWRDYNLDRVADRVKLFVQTMSEKARARRTLWVHASYGGPLWLRLAVGIAGRLELTNVYGGYTLSRHVIRLAGFGRVMKISDF